MLLTPYMVPLYNVVVAIAHLEKMVPPIPKTEPIKVAYVKLVKEVVESEK